MALDLLKKDKKQKGVKIHLPEDSVLADKFDNAAQTDVADNMNIPSGWMGLDIGEKARAAFSKVIMASKTILWNGPMGVFEMEKFREGTKTIADAVAQATANGAYSLVGGGDSVAAVNLFGYADKVSYVSTGGGAMLEFSKGKPFLV
jgi:phosphoglycerate kinase (EC 2.7.2.3)